jgi:prepilin-type N-terminal cleavage/methylation domain-containing protein
MASKNMNKGFTLIELIMVTIILGVLAAVAVPRYMGSVSNAEEAAEASTIAALRLAVEQYANQKYLEEGRYSYPSNPFDYLEVDGYVGHIDWNANYDDLVPEDGAWYLYAPGDYQSNPPNHIEIVHKRRDDNEYWWSYSANDYTNLDGDDRGANVGLSVENPNQEGIQYNDQVENGSRWWPDMSGDPDPATDGF